MFKKLEKEINKLPENFIVAFVTDSENYEKINLHILDILLKNKNSGGYITVNRPYKNIIDMLKKNKIDHKNIFFIDCITKSAGGNVSKEKNCVFIDSPDNLTELSIEIHNYIKKTKNEKKFLLIDSLSTLSIHNNPLTLLRFIHYITGKMRIFNLNGVMMSLNEETDHKIISELSQLCDKIIHV